MKRSISILAIAAALAFFAVPAFAEGGRVEYPEEWGENLALADNGATVVDTSEEAYDPINLIDGFDGEGRHYEPLWEAGRPWFFTIELAEESFISILRFDTNSRRDSGGVPQTVEILVSSDGDRFSSAFKGSLENEASQVIKLGKAVKAKFVKVMVTMDYGSSGGELGEVGVFGKAGFAGAMRGTDKYDLVRFINGDTLTGNLQTEKIEIQASFAKLSFTREQIAGITFGASITQPDVIALINGDVVNGFITTATIGLKLTSGSRIEVKQDKIAAIGFQIREGEFVGGETPSIDRVVMKAGDSLGGKFTSTTVSVATSYATMTIVLKDLASIEYAGTGVRFFRILFKNGDSIQGTIAEEKLNFDMTYGPDIPVPTDEIGMVSFAE